MARTTTAAMAVKMAQAQGAEPVYLVHILFPGDTKYYADKTMSLGGNNYIEGLVSMSQIQSQGKVDQSGEISTTNVTLDDSDGSVKLLYNTKELEGIPVEIYIWFEGLLDADKLLLMTGTMASTISWSEGEHQLAFSVESKINDDIIGFAADESSLPGIHPDAVDVPWPIVFGNVKRVPAVHIFKAIQGKTKDPEDYVSSTVIGVDGGSDFPQATPITIGIEARQPWNPITQEDHIATLYFEGQFTGDVFTTTARNVAEYTAVVLAARVVGPDFSNASIFWITDASINLVNKFCYINIGGVPSGPAVNFCYKQEGAKCFFMKPWRPNGTTAEVNLPTGFNKDLDEVAGSVRTAWGADYAIEQSDEQGNVSTPNIFPRDSWNFISGERVFYTGGNQSTYVCNLADSTSVVEVMAKRSIQTKSEQKQSNVTRLVAVPSSYFTINLTDTIAGQSVTSIVMDRQLAFRDGEGWEDDIYVSIRSSLSANTATAIKYILDTYGLVGTDSTTFGSVATDITNYPSHFAILDRPDALAISEEIAYQARCALLVKQDVVKIIYLSKLKIPVQDFTEPTIEFKSMILGFTDNDEVITRIVASWDRDLGPTDDTDQEEKDEYIYARNITKYGLTEDKIDMWIYNIESLVKASVDFWGYRNANVWRTMNIGGFFESMELETFDIARLAANQFSAIPVLSELTDTGQNPSDDSFRYAGTLSSKSGENTAGQPDQDDNYFKGDPLNPVDPPQAAPGDPLAGLALVDYLIQPASDNPDSNKNPNSNTKFVFLDVPAFVSRGVAFSVTVAFIDDTTKLLVLLNDVVTFIALASDDLDILTPNSSDLNAGILTINLTLNGGTGSGAMNIQANTPNYQAISPQVLINAQGTPKFITVPETTVRDNLFTVRIEGGTPLGAATISFNTTTTDILKDGADASVVNINFDASGVYQNQWKWAGGTEDIGEADVTVTDGPNSDTTELQTILAASSGTNPQVIDNVTGASTDGQGVYQNNGDANGDTWSLLFGVDVAKDDMVFGITLNAGGGTYDVAQEGLFDQSDFQVLPGNDDEFAPIYLTFNSTSLTTDFGNAVQGGRYIHFGYRLSSGKVWLRPRLMRVFKHVYYSVTITGTLPHEFVPVYTTNQGIAWNYLTSPNTRFDIDQDSSNFAWGLAYNDQGGNVFDIMVEGTIPVDEVSKNPDRTNDYYINLIGNDIVKNPQGDPQYLWQMGRLANGVVQVRFSRSRWERIRELGNTDIVTATIVPYDDAPSGPTLVLTSGNIADDIWKDSAWAGSRVVSLKFQTRYYNLVDAAGFIYRPGTIPKNVFGSLSDYDPGHTYYLHKDATIDDSQGINDDILVGPGGERLIVIEKGIVINKWVSHPAYAYNFVNLELSAYAASDAIASFNRAIAFSRRSLTLRCNFKTLGDTDANYRIVSDMDGQITVERFSNSANYTVQCHWAEDTREIRSTTQNIGAGGGTVSAPLTNPNVRKHEGSAIVTPGGAEELIGNFYQGNLYLQIIEDLNGWEHEFQFRLDPHNLPIRLVIGLISGKIENIDL